MKRLIQLGLVSSVVSALFTPGEAQAFCGFYVSGADASLYANASLVVMMRDGTQTVLSLQNSYQGPPEDFALVVPVPVVIQEENVKTLPKEVFQRIDALSAPRLVEYWEQDPCRPPVMYDLMATRSAMPSMMDDEMVESEELGVTVEAEFSVAEYDVVILSAKDSGGLDTWLRREKYNIPEGAEPVLRGYVEQGTKFFVAKVDVEKVKFVDGVAVLSPLRVNYESKEFSLPVRLGLLNSEGEQDLLVHILARGQRYEVANYDNVSIPTNIRVLSGAKDDFGDFYDALFRQTVAEKPKAVVTEYSWDASSCDPCPTPPLDYSELTTLGTDVFGGNNYGWVLTRLHYRYTKDTLGEDLVFKAAPPVVGGRGTPNPEGVLAEQQPQPSGMNNFQGRYFVLHPWEGELTCDNPTRGQWGGPGGRSEPPPMGAPSELSGAHSKSDGQANLPALVDEDIPWIGVKKAAASRGGDAATPEPGKPGATLTPAVDGQPPALEDGEPDVDDRGCASAPRSTGLMGLALLAFALLSRRRR